MSDLSDLVHRLMRDVTQLNPMEPGAHFLAMLEGRGFMITRMIEGEMSAKSIPLSEVYPEVKTEVTAIRDKAAAGLATAERLIAEAKAKRTKT